MEAFRLITGPKPRSIRAFAADNRTCSLLAFWQRSIRVCTPSAAPALSLRASSSRSCWSTFGFRSSSEARTRAAARAAQKPGAFTGTLSVGIDGCRRDGAPIPKAFRVSTWIRTAETPSYVPLLEDVDLVALVGTEKLAEAKVCPAS